MNTDEHAERDTDTTRGIELARSAVRLLRGSDTGHRVRVGTMALGSLALVAVGSPLADQLHPAAQNATPASPPAPHLPAGDTSTTANKVETTPPPGSPITQRTPAAPATRTSAPAAAAPPRTSVAVPVTPQQPGHPRHLDASRSNSSNASPVLTTPPPAPGHSLDQPPISSPTRQMDPIVRQPTAEPEFLQHAPMSATPEVSAADVQAMIERVIGLLDELRGPVQTTLAPAVPAQLPTTTPPLAPPDPIDVPAVTALLAGTPSPALPIPTLHPSLPAPPVVLPAPVPRPPAPAPGGQVGQWIAQATAILASHGVPATEMNPHDIAVIIQHESGGNPRAVNRTDANARAGHPSKGLMQTVDATFNRYALPGHDDVYNPVDNIIAGVRYAIAKYGAVSNVPGVRSTAVGHGYRGY